MARMGVGPVAKLDKGFLQRIDVAAEIDVRYVQDFQARRLHASLGIVRQWRMIGSPNHLEP
jgi:hypothetical protein